MARPLGHRRRARGRSWLRARRPRRRERRARSTPSTRARSTPTTQSTSWSRGWPTSPSAFAAGWTGSAKARPHFPKDVLIEVVRELREAALDAARLAPQRIPGTRLEMKHGPPGRAGRHDPASSVAPVASGYRHAPLRPCLALDHRTRSARGHSETSSPGRRQAAPATKREARRGRAERGNQSLEWIRSTVPATAPSSIPRRQRQGPGERCAPGTAAEPGLRRDPGQGQREDRRREVGDREPAGGGVLDAHRQREERDQRIAAVGAEVSAGDGRNGDGTIARRGQNRPWPPRRTGLAPVDAQARAEPGVESAGRDPPRQEKRERPQQAPDRGRRRGAAKPRNTMLPVMLATNTCPSREWATASTTPVTTVSKMSRGGNPSSRALARGLSDSTTPVQLLIPGSCLLASLTTGMPPRSSAGAGPRRCVLSA